MLSVKSLDDRLSQVRDEVALRAVEGPGVFRRRDLLRWGVDDTCLQTMFRRGLWVRLRHGVYADAERLLGAQPDELHRIHLAAAILAADEPTLAFGPSAALLHGLPLPFPAPDAVHLVRESRQDLRSLARPSRHRLTIPPMVLTSHVGLDPAATIVSGIPSVSVSVAAVSASAMFGFTRRVGLFDAVLWDGSTTSDDLRAVVDQWPGVGSRSSILAALEQARRGAQTYLETLSRVALVRLGLPEPVLQAPFYDGDGLIGYVDMYWPELRVIGEADGAVKYSDRADLISEKRREDRLREAGFTVVRWMWQDVTTAPEVVAERIRRAARRAA